MNARDVGFGLAAALAVVGLLAVFTPLLDARALAADRLRPLLALGSLAVGLGLLRRWYHTEPATHEPVERERRSPAAGAGDEFDDLLALSDAGSGESARFYRSQAREELEAVAVAVLTTYRDLPPERARRQLATGEWTGDEVAASFFVAGADAPAEVRSLLQRGGDGPATRRARRAVAELRRIAEAEVAD